jgi:hypothetical protein
MSTAKFIPAQPAVTQVVTPAVPAKVVLEMDVETAGKLRALLGRCCGSGLYEGLDALAGKGAIPDYVLHKHRATVADFNFDFELR